MKPTNTSLNSGITDTLEVVGVEEACRICSIEIEFVQSLVFEGVFEQVDHEPSVWRFNRDELATLRKAARLYQDLAVNPAGIALILELLQRLRVSKQGP